ncbi:MAG: diacylglycerol/lipid kinase family protein [Bacilli bacterium]
MHIFIINPKAGNGKGIELISRLKELEKKIIHVTKEKGDATKFLLVVAKKYPNATIYSVGGDGTLNEVVNGIYDKNCKLHIVPFGSGNDYNRIIKSIYEKKLT